MGLIPDDLAARLRADDEAAWQVFGDWLLERDDWRAPLVAMERQLAADDDYDQDAYEQDQERFWAEHVEHLRITGNAEAHPPRVPDAYDIHEHGAVFGDPRVHINVGRDATATLVIGRWGWARSMVLFLGGDPDFRGQPAGPRSPPLPPLLRGAPQVDDGLAALIASEACALLTSLQIGFFGEGRFSLERVTEALRARCDQLVELGLGGARILESMPGLVDALPRLERLDLGCPGPIRPLCLPALRRLHVRELTSERLAAVSASELPALRHLELWFWEYEGDLAGFETIAAGRALSALDSLALLIPDVEGSDRVLSRLVPSPLLDRLRALDLKTTTIGDGAADLLIANAGALRRLEDLRLSSATGPGAERVRQIADA